MGKRMFFGCCPLAFYGFCRACNFGVAPRQFQTSTHRHYYCDGCSCSRVRRFWWMPDMDGLGSCVENHFFVLAIPVLLRRANPAAHKLRLLPPSALLVLIVLATVVAQLRTTHPMSVMIKNGQATFWPRLVLL